MDFPLWFMVEATLVENQSGIGVGMMILLRSATLADAAFLLACRNDPETVRQFIQSRRVSPSEHLRWLKAILKNPRRRLFVAEAVVSGYFGPSFCWNLQDRVGTGRLDWNTETVEFSVTVAPEHRGQGYGKAIVAALVKEAQAWKPKAKMVANIKGKNVASLRAFLGAGFSMATNRVVRLERGGDEKTDVYQKKNGSFQPRQISLKAIRELTDVGADRTRSQFL